MSAPQFSSSSNVLHGPPSSGEAPCRKTEWAEACPPLRFQPLYKDYLWGGNRLATVLNRPLDPAKTVAEAWEIADHPHGESRVAKGSLRGMTLGEILTFAPKPLLGEGIAPVSIPFPRHAASACRDEGDGRNRFPVMVKLLDSNRALSVQVHPSDAVAQGMRLSDPGKTEAWIVMEARPGAKMWLGFKKPFSRKTVQRAIEEGNLVDLLSIVEPRKGDCFLVEAGTVHALGSGLLVAEIQQNSDATFRLFDWNRLGPDGKPRPLHIAQACDSIDYTSGPTFRKIPRQTGHSNRWELVRMKYFSVDRWHVEKNQIWKPDGLCHIFTVLEGILDVSVVQSRKAGPLRVIGSETERLTRGETLLIPAGCGELCCQAFTGETILLDVTVYCPPSDR